MNVPFITMTKREKAIILLKLSTVQEIMARDILQKLSQKHLNLNRLRWLSNQCCKTSTFSYKVGNIYFWINLNFIQIPNYWNRSHSYQGRHGWEDPQGLSLAWILQNKKRQPRHPADVATTVAALPVKNWQWRPCIYSVNKFSGILVLTLSPTYIIFLFLCYCIFCENMARATVPSGMIYYE